MTSAVKRKATELALADAKKPKANGNIAAFFGGPKTSSSPSSSASFSSAAAPAIKFDKAQWVAKLTAEQKDLLKLEIDTLHDSWLAHLKEEVVSKEFLDLKRFLKTERASGKTIFPPMEDVYSWSRHTPLPTVKAVILGQDPYHNHNQAHGLCFSVRPPTPAPPSLKNMYIALRNDYPSFVAPPKNGGLLTPWADRGVLMLNTCLTVRAHEANSHAGKGWERFTQKVIDTVAKVRTRGVVFLAWGTPAGKRVAKVDRKRHCVLQSVHPSPLSASRGFFQCRHFKLTNEWLQERYGDDGPIDWNLGAASIQAAKEEGSATVAAHKGVVTDTSLLASEVTTGPTEKPTAEVPSSDAVGEKSAPPATEEGAVAADLGAAAASEVMTEAELAEGLSDVDGV